MNENAPITVMGQHATMLTISCTSAGARYPGGPDMIDLAFKDADAFPSALYRMLDRLALPAYFEKPLAERPAIRIIQPHAAIDAEQWRSLLVTGSIKVEAGPSCRIFAHKLMHEPSPLPQRVVLALGRELLLESESGWTDGGRGIFNLAKRFGLGALSLSAGPLLLLDSLRLPSKLWLPLDVPDSCTQLTAILYLMGKERHFSGTNQIPFSPDNLYAFRRIE